MNEAEELNYLKIAIRLANASLIAAEGFSLTECLSNYTDADSVIATNLLTPILEQKGKIYESF